MTLPVFEKYGELFVDVLFWTGYIIVVPSAETLCEQDYGTVIRLFRDEVAKLRNEYPTARRDDMHYYSAWVHQIKTPITVMRKELGESEMENTRALETELFRIELYVDIVLTYIQQGSESTDLVIREYPLDTGGNGRLDKHSSGLWLYLSKKEADLLQIPLSVKSVIGEGSRFSLDLKSKAYYNKKNSLN